MTFIVNAAGCNGQEGSFAENTIAERITRQLD